IEVYKNRAQKITTSELNETMLAIIEKNPPPSTKGKYIRIKYCTMLPTPTPSFAFFANLPQYIKEPYKRFLENKIREIYNFSGVPIIIYFRQK
ncbi:MAG: ribosome biogenesis GTPase Der, partial [Flavobacteriales bacterium]|nr:ribosome biogenesis GTPase Der [Flavobacteriales bacterium]